jgi:hypothetical protein
MLLYPFPTHAGQLLVVPGEHRASRHGDILEHGDTLTAVDIAPNETAILRNRDRHRQVRRKTSYQERRLFRGRPRFEGRVE